MDQYNHVDYFPSDSHQIEDPPLLMVIIFYFLVPAVVLAGFILTNILLARYFKDKKYSKMKSLILLIVVNLLWCLLIFGYIYIFFGEGSYAPHIFTHPSLTPIFRKY